MSRAKVGADDFIASGLGEDLNGLPRTAAGPRVTRHGDDVIVAWDDPPVTLTLQRVSEHREGIAAEVVVQHGGAEIHWGRLNLVSTAAREALVKKLAAAVQAVAWRPLLEHACRRAAEVIRISAPAAVLVPQRRTAEPYALAPLYPAGQTTLVTADGGGGKSFLALATGAAIASACPLPAGLSARLHGPVLYLDWESCQADHEDRLALLEAGLGVSLRSMILYQPMHRALADELPGLRALVAREGIIAVIIDSLAPACGAEPETADSAIRVMNGLRSFGDSVTRIALAHIPKGAVDHRGPARPFGSVFFGNLARSVWELRRAEDDTDNITMALYHRKANSGRLHPPIGLRFGFATDRITVTGHNLSDEPDLRARLPLAIQIKGALRGGWLSAAKMADQLAVEVETIGRTLRRLEEKGAVTRRPDSKPIEWGLATR